MKVCETSFSFLHFSFFHFLSLFSVEYAAKYGKWFGFGVEDYDKYKESLRRVVDEGESVVLVMMDVGDVEEGCRLFCEREVYGWDELVRFFFLSFFLSFLSSFFRSPFFVFVCAGCERCVHVRM